MDYLSLKKINHLFWLGRYQARLRCTLQYLAVALDKMLDGEEFDYQKFCQQLDIPCAYKNTDDFFNRYIFAKDNPASLRVAAEEMLGNGMTLRETIGTPTLSYLQLALYRLKSAAESNSPALCFQEVVDCLLAFIGSCDQYIDNVQARYVIECGSNTELLSLYLRLDYPDEPIEKTLRKLMDVADVTAISMDLSALHDLMLQRRQLDEGFPLERSAELLQAVEGLFVN